MLPDRPGELLQGNEFKPQLPLSYELARVAVSGLTFFLVMTGAVYGLAKIAEHKRQEPMVGFFAYKGCAISYDAHWRAAKNDLGLDYLTVRYVKGVKGESGPGSECLNAVNEVIVDWSRDDGVGWNDISDGWTVQAGANYLVPDKAHKLG